jgi:hypothetical protein
VLAGHAKLRRRLGGNLSFAISRLIRLRVDTLATGKIAMLAFFGKLFRSRRPAAPSPLPARTARGFYTVVAPVWRTDEQRGIYRGLSGDAIAIVQNLDQALTLQDTLNLANGDPPSRRLLDAIYREDAETVAGAPR